MVVVSMPAEDMHGVGTVDVVFCKRLGCGTACYEFTVQKEDMVKKCFHAFEIVMRGDNELACFTQTAHGLGKGIYGVSIKPREGFIKQVDIGFLCPRPCEECALLLSAGEG